MIQNWLLFKQSAFWEKGAPATAPTISFIFRNYSYMDYFCLGSFGKPKIFNLIELDLGMEVYQGFGKYF